MKGPVHKYLCLLQQQQLSMYHCILLYHVRNPAWIETTV